MDLAKASVDPTPAQRIKAPDVSAWLPNPRQKRLLFNSVSTAHRLLETSSGLQQYRHLSTSCRRTMTAHDTMQASENGRLTHVTEAGAARMVSISEKNSTKRRATAQCFVRFSDSTPSRLIDENQMRKGDVLAVARIAGIMAAKRTSDLIPLCHPIAISQVTVDLEVVAPQAKSDQSGAKAELDNGVKITATVACDGKTGVEMEALTAASTAALTVYDMCKAVDKGIVIEGLKVVLKEGGKSGRWVDGVSTESKT
jgi:GTP 3',8-cyclase